MTPPRSMSPMSTTGRSAASAKPILAMSPARRLASAGLPAPSTRTRSALSASAAKLSRARGRKVDFSDCQWAALALPQTLPWITTWAPTSLWGLSSTGFICTEGATPQARAWSAWARPISPPSAVTAALLDMFCGLKGRTASPRLRKARASPATISDLPTSEPVPWNITAGTRLTPVSAQPSIPFGLGLQRFWNFVLSRLSFPSSPRKRGSRGKRRVLQAWSPAFAGMTSGRTPSANMTK